MAMDKNDLTRLLVKVPKINKNESLEKQDQLDFLDSQILERKKILFRFAVQVETAKGYAAKDDKEANDLAEVKIREATGHMKAVKWELETLLKLREDLAAE